MGLLCFDAISTPLNPFPELFNVLGGTHNTDANRLWSGSQTAVERAVFGEAVANVDVPTAGGEFELWLVDKMQFHSSDPGS